MAISAAENPQNITITEQIRSKYRYWRFRMLYSAMLGYAMFYIVRKNISMALPGMEHDLGITKDKLGLFLTLTTLLYGVSKFVNGMWGDRVNPRIFMPIGLFGAAMMNVFFGMSSTVWVFGFLWLINGWFQGMGCAPCIKTLSNWYPSSERGVRFAIWNISHNIGSSSVMLINSALVLLSFYTWRLSFFVPACIAILGSLFLFNRLRDTPESLGLPPVEEIYGHKPEMEHSSKDAKGKISGKEYRHLLLTKVFGNPGVWLVGIASFFLYIVRFSILDWGPTFLKEMKGLPLSSAGIAVAGTEVAGLCGTLVGGWLMDKAFKGNGSLVCLIYMLLCGVFAFLFWILPVKSVLVYAVLLCGMSFMVYGPQSMIGPITANMATKNAAAAAVGFAGFFSYMSGAVSGWGLGLMVVKMGWHRSFVWIIVSCIISAMCYAVPAIWDFSHKKENI